MKKYICLLLIISIISACTKSSSGTTDPAPSSGSSSTTVAVYAITITSGTYKTTLTITGAGFSANLTDNKVFFNGVPATVIAFALNGPTQTVLKVSVPFGAGTGNVSVSVNNGPLVAGPVFTYLLPINSNIFAGSYISDLIDGTGTAAAFKYPQGMAMDAAGNIYVADSQNNVIRKITPAAVVSTFAGSHPIGGPTVFSLPSAVATDAAGNVYVADAGDNVIKKITSSGVVSTIAGTGSAGVNNGIGTVASFNLPTGIVLDPQGNIYVSDTNNHIIRKITALGVVSIFCGSGTVGTTDGSGTSASFNQPHGLAIDAAGNLYVADYGNNNIRKITPTGIVTTFAGSVNGTPGSADGTGTAASFHQPVELVVDATGNIDVADYGNSLVRKISPTGVVVTYDLQIGGGGNPGYINQPAGIVVDAAGNIYTADSSGMIHKSKEITTP